MKKIVLANLILALFTSFASAACNPWYQHCSQSQVFVKTCWGFDGKQCLCCNAHKYTWVGGEPVCRGSIWLGKIQECLKY